MQVTEEPMAFDEYDHAYPERRPSPTNRFGDNIYFINGSGTFEQRLNERHRSENMEHDLSGRSVLVSRRFVYFGDALPEIPPDLHIVKKGPGHRSNFEPSVVTRLIDRTNELVGEHGWNRCHGRPNDESRL